MPSLLVSELDIAEMKKRYKTIDELDGLLLGWDVGTADIVNFISGGVGLKLTALASATTTSTKSFGALDLGGNGDDDEVRFWVWIDIINNLSQLQIKFTDSAGSPVTATLTRTGAQLAQGYNRISFPKSAFTNGATINWTDVASAQLVVTASGLGTVAVTFDMIRLMLGPTIGYTSGRWDESNAVADIIDDQLVILDGGYWQLNDARIKPTDFYRLNAGR